MTNIAIKSKSDKFVQWLISIEPDVVAMITGFLVIRAVSRKTITLDEIRELVRYKYNEQFTKNKELLSEKDLSEWIYDCVLKISEWEVRYSRPALSSLVVRANGADAGLPHNGFWTANMISATRKEKKILIDQFHSKVFAYYGINED